MLTTRALTVRYGDTIAVNDVDLTVADGAVLALLGPSGCGKSTLLRAVAGLEPASAGSVRWDDADLERIPVHRRGFGLMFQDGVLFPHRTVAGNVGYGLRAWASRTARAARISELLELVGLSGYHDRRVATLSGGEAQRVALARALAPEPRLLLLDEPLAALDRSLRESLLIDLRTVLETTGTTAIFVTHDQSEAFAVADRIAVMRAGRIVQSAPPRELWNYPSDEWTARFLGCTSVLDAVPEQGVDGRWRSVTAVGTVSGRARRVGLRPTALVAEAAGPVTGEIRAVTPGPERKLLTVRLTGGGPGSAAADESGEFRAGNRGGNGGNSGDGGNGGNSAEPARDGPRGDRADAGEFTVRAVAAATGTWLPGDLVQLRFDPEGAALIGAEPVVEPDPESRAEPVAETGAARP